MSYLFQSKEKGRYIYSGLQLDLIGRIFKEGRGREVRSLNIIKRNSGVYSKTYTGLIF